MGLGKEVCSVAMFILILLTSIITIYAGNVEGGGYDVDIIVGFDDYWMEQELGPDHEVTGPLPIHWYAHYHDGSDLIIDLYLRPEFSSEWTLIAEGLENTGTYTWDLHYPKVPDGDYILKVLAMRDDGSYCDAESQFIFHVTNKKMPIVTILNDLENAELRGKFELHWDVVDEDTPRYKISSDIYLSSDDGSTFTHLQGFYEDPGFYIMDTSEFPNGDLYRFRVDVIDRDMLSSHAVSERFAVFNNAPPEVNITTPKHEQGVYGKFTICWDSDDMDEPSNKLLVDLWYETKHDGAKVDLLRRAPNHGCYKWDTSAAKSGPQGHSIFVQLTDSMGLMSHIDKVDVWVLSNLDDLLRDVEYPRGEVKDVIEVTWKTYPPAHNVSNELNLWIYHRSYGSEWELLIAGGPDTGSFTLDVTNRSDGFHGIKIVIMDSVQTWIYDEIEVQVEVYHEHEPQMYIRDHPDNGTEANGTMTFEIAGFDGNGDQLTYMGLYCPVGGGWNIFDLQKGNYKQELEWNTSGIPPGEYMVRLAVYDGSRYNLSTSMTVGPYIVKDDGSYDFIHPRDGDSRSGLSSILKMIIALVIVLGIVGITIGLLIMRDMNKATKRAIGPTPIHPKYLGAYTRFKGRNQVLERLLPSLGGSSGTDLIVRDIQDPHGLELEEAARVQGYLEMLDPDLVDDVTRSDMESYSILGVSRDADENEIKKVYMGFIKRYHPDKLIGKDRTFIEMAEEELRKKNRARSILLDPQRRTLIDKMLRDSEGELIRNSSVRSLDEIRSLGRK